MLRWRHEPKELEEIVQAILEQPMKMSRKQLRGPLRPKKAGEDPDC